MNNNQVIAMRYECPECGRDFDLITDGWTMDFCPYCGTERGNMGNESYIGEVTYEKISEDLVDDRTATECEYSLTLIQEVIDKIIKARMLILQQRLYAEYKENQDIDEEIEIELPQFFSPLEVDTLEELNDYLEDYMSSVPRSTIKVLDMIYFSDMTDKSLPEHELFEAKFFIECFNNFNIGEGDYRVTFYDLNDELGINFEDKEEACEFASKICPSVVNYWAEGSDCVEEIACY